MDLVPDKGQWRVPVLKTVATDGHGIGELRETIARHHDFLKSGNRLTELRRRRVGKTVIGIVREVLHRMVWDDSYVDELFNRKIDEIMAGNATPHSVAEEILREKHLVRKEKSEDGGQKP